MKNMWRWDKLGWRKQEKELSRGSINY